MITLKRLFKDYKRPRYKENNTSKDYLNTLVGLISLPITWVLLLTNITANQITFFSIFIWTVGCYFISSGSLWLGIILLYLFWVLDACDGTVARYKHQQSNRGCYLEAISHNYGDPVLMISLGFYTGLPTLGFLTAFVKNQSEIYILKKNQIELHNNTDTDLTLSNSKLLNLYHYLITTNSMFLLIPIFGILNLLNYYLLFLFIIHLFNAIMQFQLNYKRI